MSHPLSGEPTGIPIEDVAVASEEEWVEKEGLALRAAPKSAAMPGLEPGVAQDNDDEDEDMDNGEEEKEPEAPDASQDLENFENPVIRLDINNWLWLTFQGRQYVAGAVGEDLNRFHFNRLQ